MASHSWTALVAVFCMCIGTIEACGTQERLGIGQHFTFTSPDFPNPYPGVECRWEFFSPENTIMKLNCEEFKVFKGRLGCIDMFYFSGQLTNGRYTPFCGTEIKWVDMYTTTNYSEVYFSSLGNFGYKGFKCMITVLEENTNDEQVITDCGKSSLRSRIVNGLVTEVHAWPWQVAIREIQDDWQFCGGSLISPNWVLTAAHCMEGQTEEDILVVLGEHDIISGSETNQTVKHHVSKIIVHSGYINGWKNKIHDIAVLQLTNPVLNSEGVSPVCLPINFRNVMFEGESAITTGWGHTSEGGHGSKDLREVTLPVIANSKCSNMYDRNIYSDQMCAYEEGKDSCQGDSGGPLVWKDDNNRYHQIGIVSWGDGCARKYKPGIYARVTSYIDWIQENTNTRFSYIHD